MFKKYDVVERISLGRSISSEDSNNGVKGSYVVFRNNKDQFSYVYKVKIWPYIKHLVIIAFVMTVAIIAVFTINYHMNYPLSNSMWVLILFLLLLGFVVNALVDIRKHMKIYKVPFTDPKEAAQNYGMYSEMSIRTPGL